MCGQLYPLQRIVRRYSAVAQVLGVHGFLQPFGRLLFELHHKVWPKYARRGTATLRIRSSWRYAWALRIRADRCVAVVRVPLFGPVVPKAHPWCDKAIYNVPYNWVCVRTRFSAGDAGVGREQNRILLHGRSNYRDTKNLCLCYVTEASFATVDFTESVIASRPRCDLRVANRAANLPFPYLRTEKQLVGVECLKVLDLASHQLQAELILGIAEMSV